MMSAVMTGVIWLDAEMSEVGLEALGGKARSLVRLVRAGLGESVPPGFVVPAAPAVLGGLDDGSADAIREAYGALGERLGQSEPLVAVRSSGTAEDLAEASYAGQYETYLGV